MFETAKELQVDVGSFDPQMFSTTGISSNWAGGAP